MINTRNFGFSFYIKQNVGAKGNQLINLYDYLNVNKASSTFLQSFQDSHLYSFIFILILLFL